MTSQSTYDATVNSFYLAFYGRPADPAGLQFWSQQLASVNGDLHAISSAFSTSEETLTRFGSGDTTARITDIYQQLFNRAPDAAGLAYWTDVVEKGHASLATVAIEILKGAQGSDHTLADLRQQAMDKFTAQVQAAGSAYDGYASIEASRVLVRAVTAGASAADIDTLVKAAVSFADTATKTPAVVEALATGTTLLNLYDTARGNADPVSLTQTLADAAKAAAGNPVTLDSLLRGGGMDKVLKVMPAEATLHDVVEALATGGLPAAVEVVYPTPPAPTFDLQLAFAGVAQGSGDTQVDNVTNVAVAEVKFSYTGSGLKAGQHIEYSVDGGATWHKDGIAVSAADHSVTIAGIDLEHGTAASSGSIQHIKTAIDNLPNLLTTVSVRAVDAGGATTAPVSHQIVYDHFAATPRIALVEDTAGAGFGNGFDFVTRDGSYTVGRIEAGATVEYLLNDSSTWTKDAPTLIEGENTLAVHQIDAAGNVSGTALATIIVDTKAPAAPSIALATDSGNGSDAITRVGKIAIAGLDTDIETAWEYSTDGGATWTFGDVNDGSGKAELDLTGKGDGLKDVQVRQLDLAGNVGAASNHVVFTLDANAPGLSVQLTFVGISEGKNDLHHDNVTNLASANVAFIHAGDELSASQHFEYSLDGINWHREGVVTEPSMHLVGMMDIDLRAGVAAGPALQVESSIDGLPNLVTTVHMRVFDDASGESTVPVSQEIVYDRYVATPTITLDNDTAGKYIGTHADLVTRDGSFSVGAVEAGATVEYLVDTIPGSIWTPAKPVLEEGLNSFTVRQTDNAGNVSETRHVEITVDTKAPASPTIALVTDSGIAGDGITAIGKVAIAGLDTDVKTAWEYSTNGGDTWTFGHANDGSGTAELALTVAGEQYVLVRQVDLAGNVGVVSNQIAFTLDPNAPAPAVDIAFKGVTQGLLDTQTDNVTNVAHPEIQFGYTGDLGDYRFEYSLDGVSWSDEGVVAANNVVTVNNVDLTMGTAPSTGGIFPILPPGTSYDPSMPFPGNPNFMLPPANLETTVHLRLVDANGNAVGDAVSQKIVYDSYVQPVQAGPDAYIPYVGYGPLTKDGAWSAYGFEDGTTLEYLVDQVTTPLVVTGNPLDPYQPIVQPATVVAGTEWTKVKPMLAEGYNSIAVRQVDAAGNVSDVTRMTVVYDSKAPAAPVVTLVEDTGTAGDMVSSKGKILVTGLESAFLTSWEYRSEGDENWYHGGESDGSGQAELDLSYQLAQGPVSLQVRQLDAARNPSAISDTLKFTFDKIAPAGSFDFKYVEAPHMQDNAVTDLASAGVTFAYTGEPAADDLFQYRVDGGDWITLGADAYDSQAHQLVTGKVDFSQADHQVEVRAIDKAGNEGPSASVQVDSTFNNPQAEKSTMIYVNVSMYTSAPMLYFTADPYGITNATGAGSENGLANKASLTLQNMNIGTPGLPPDDYFDGPGFSFEEGTMSLDTMPRLGFYKLNWTDETFLTSGPSGHGYVAAGSALFVAGGAGTTTVRGFTVENTVMITGDVNELNGTVSNTAYIGSPNVNARIQTGGGMDLVSDNNGKLTIVYDTFDSSAQDVILGFDIGNDVIEINGDAASALDDNNNGQIDWTIASATSKMLVGSNAEAVRIRTTGILTTSPVSYEAEKTVATLSAAIDVSGLRVGDDLLLLAGTTDHNALIWYQEMNGDGKINANELTFVAVTGSGGAIDMQDIQLVGTAIGGGIEG